MLRQICRRIFCQAVFHAFLIAQQSTQTLSDNIRRVQFRHQTEALPIWLQIQAHRACIRLWIKMQQPEKGSTCLSRTYPAIIVTAFTAVKRVISFLRRSRKIGKQTFRFGPRASPMLQMTWPLKPHQRKLAVTSINITLTSQSNKHKFTKKWLT